jgi:hypothetical protein
VRGADMNIFTPHPPLRGTLSLRARDFQKKAPDRGFNPQPGAFLLRRLNGPEDQAGPGI